MARQWLRSFQMLVVYDFDYADLQLLTAQKSKQTPAVCVMFLNGETPSGTRAAEVTKTLVAADVVAPPLAGRPDRLAGRPDGPVRLSTWPSLAARLEREPVSQAAWLAEL